MYEDMDALMYGCLIIWIYGCLDVRLSVWQGLVLFPDIAFVSYMQTITILR